MVDDSWAASDRKTGRLTSGLRSEAPVRGAGMGGGTGTGAAPIIAQAAREQDAIAVNPTTKSYGTVLKSQTGSFATGVLILSAQWDLHSEFGGYVQLGMSPETEDALMECMYQYVMGHDDDAITEHIQPRPGVLDHLRMLSNMQKSSEDVFCGLVTGNVEGIARRKMQAVGVLDPEALSPPCPASQLQKWPETADLAFLGGFGSDCCGKDLNNLDRNYLDRAEQIAICARRCRNVMKSSQSSDDGATAVCRDTG